MTRYAVYAVPGILEEIDPGAEGADAIALRATVESWYAREEFRGLTVDARRYGFHATLKAPFRLAEGRTEEELRAAAGAFAAAREPIRLPALAPQPLGDFRALLPHGDQEQIDLLAADAVSEFDGFRAPLAAAEVQRRRPDRMTPRERELFERWGYPYVMDRFRFHLTLTDPVPESRRAEVDDALRAHFADVQGADVVLRSIALCVEREPGSPFAVLSAHPFRTSAPPQSVAATPEEAS